MARSTAKGAGSGIAPSLLRVLSLLVDSDRDEAERDSLSKSLEDTVGVAVREF